MNNEGKPSGGGKFPPTRWSAVLAARSADPAERTPALNLPIAAR